MSTNGIRVEEFNIYSLGAEAVSYHLKNIHTLALQVTPENIGILCLELETELIYTAEGEPYIVIYVARGTKEEPEQDRNLVVRPTNWLVILWDEIHLFRDKEFRSTFSFDGLSAPAEKELREYAEADAKATAALFKPNVEVLSALGATPEDIEEQKVLARIAEPALERAAEKEAEKTQIVPAVGELDTDESNGSV